MDNQAHNSNSNTIHLLLYALLLSLLALSLYFNFSAKEPVKVNQTEIKIEKTERFEDLPNDIQAAYVSRSEFDALKSSLEALSTQKSQEQNATQSECREEVTIHEANVTKPSMDEIVKSKDYAACYNMEIGSVIIDYACKRKIEKFVDAHKDAKYFEIIGVVDTLEFKLYKSLERNAFIYENLRVNQKIVDRMKNFSETGLAHLRANEANWLIKSHTAQKARTYSAHYKITTDDGKRGVIIRAYR